MHRLSIPVTLALPAVLTLACENDLVDPRPAQPSPATTAKTATGGRILFASNRDDDPTNPLVSDVFVMNSDGSGLTNLTLNPAQDGNPAWSGNGKRIAFGSDRDGNGEIYLMNPDGSALTNITNNPAEDGNRAGQAMANRSPSPATATETSKSM